MHLNKQESQTSISATAYFTNKTNSYLTNFKMMLATRKDQKLTLSPISDTTLAPNSTGAVIQVKTNFYLVLKVKNGNRLSN
jgi:Adaptin C-terminal domain